MHHGTVSGSLSLEVTIFPHEQYLLDLHATDDSGKTLIYYALEEANKKRHPDLFAGSRWRKALKSLFLTLSYLIG